MSLVLAPAAVPGDVDANFNPNVTGGYVTTTAVQPDGKILIGGYFDSVNSQPRNFIARLLADGSVESIAAFNPGTGPDGGADNVAVQADGKILIGGGITSVDDQPRNRIARLLLNGSVESTATFNPGTGADGQVASLAVQADGKILLGGFFTNVNGQPRNHIARLNSDGIVESTATFNPGIGADGVISSVAVQADGRILIGGFFTSVDGQPRTNIARLNSDGSVESTATFNPGNGANGEVRSIALQADGKIVLGGIFTSVNGQPRMNIARLNANGTVESTNTFNPGTGSDRGVSSVVVQADGKILFGGFFTSVNGQPRMSIARLNADGTVESTATFNPGTGPNDEIFSVAVQADGKILLAGLFTAVNGQPRTTLARLSNDAATQILSVPSRERILWLRGGAAPEVEQVTFELSTDAGANWSLLGLGTRIAGGWELIGLSLPVSGLVRARGRTTGGYQNGSSGLAETVSAFSFIPTFTVTNTLDSGPGSLRQAIMDANTNADANSIAFNIPPGGPQSIAPASPLPAITSSVTLDATTQPGFAGHPLIELNGESAGPVANGLTILNGAIVRGLVINRFSSNGVFADVAGNMRLLEGNYIGTDLSGTVARGNGQAGIYSFSPLTQIGGTNAGSRNVVSGNGTHGIFAAGRQQILGNFIGVDVSGTNPLGNGLHGVFWNAGIGVSLGDGTATGANVIAYNGAAGVAVSANASRCAILGNSIYANGTLGIDLGANGVTLNDEGDGDGGANLQQNFPVLTAATNTSTNLTVLGTLASGTNKAYRLDFYSNPVCDPSGYGEGRTHLGFTNVTTDASGNASFRAVLPPIAGEPYLSATASDLSTNTSEFSLCLQATGVPPVGVKLSIACTELVHTVSWPGAAAAYRLESAPSLTPPILWQPITNGITYGPTVNFYAVTNGPPIPMRFYRLRWP